MRMLNAAHPELEGVVVWARQVPSDKLERIHRAMAGYVHTEFRGIVRCETREAARGVFGQCVVQRAVVGCACASTISVRVTIAADHDILVLYCANKRRDVFETTTSRTRKCARIIICFDVLAIMDSSGALIPKWTGILRRKRCRVLNVAYCDDFQHYSALRLTSNQAQSRFFGKQVSFRLRGTAKFFRGRKYPKRGSKAVVRWSYLMIKVYCFGMGSDG